MNGKELADALIVALADRIKIGAKIRKIRAQLKALANEKAPKPKAATKRRAAPHKRAAAGGAGRNS